MRLSQLDPRWVMVGEVRIGFVFRSPTNGAMWQSCFQRPTPPSRTQRSLFEAMFGEDDHLVQSCSPEAHWDIVPDLGSATWETISVTPSLDGSRGGLWHGHITNGEIVGGL